MSAGGRKINPDVLRRLWEGDMRTKDIAEHFGVLSPAVCRAAHRLGLEPRPHGTRAGCRNKPKAEERPKLLRTYATVQELAEAKGLTQRQALQHFHRMRA